MRIGIVRGDLPGPILLGDLEPISQFNPGVEPRGQEVYYSRPTGVEVEVVLADPVVGVGAVIEGADLTADFPLTIDGTNDTLRVSLTPAAAFTEVNIAQAIYANFGDLLLAVQAALAAVNVSVREGTTANTVAIESIVKGSSSYLAVDTILNGSTANVALRITDGDVRTVPSGAEFVLTLLPIGGPIDVSDSAVSAVGVGTAVNALSFIPTSRGTNLAIANALTLRIAETTVAQDSYLVGMLSKYQSASFNPDSRRGLLPGSAIEVVQDDGVTPPTFTIPLLLNAALNVGEILINGVGMGHPERDEDTVVKVSGSINMTLSQKKIEMEGGTVTATSILLPASLVSNAVAGHTYVQVRVRGRASNTLIVL